VDAWRWTYNRDYCGFDSSISYLTPFLTSQKEAHFGRTHVIFKR